MPEPPEPDPAYWKGRSRLWEKRCRHNRNRLRRAAEIVVTMRSSLARDVDPETVLDALEVLIDQLEDALVDVDAIENRAPRRVR